MLSGDHVYKMDYAKMLRFHLEQKRRRDDRDDRSADRRRLAVRHRQHRRIGPRDRIRREAAARDAGAAARRIPRWPRWASTSSARTSSTRALEEDAARPDSQHDFGKNIIPSLIQSSPVYSYRFYDENKKAAKYWRDIGTLDA